MRKRIYEIIDEAYENDSWSKAYDVFMILTIVASLIPLAFKESTSTLKLIDYITVSFFIIDYALRLITADIKFKKNKPSSFLIYPFTPMAIVDMLAILPTVTPLSYSFKLLKLLKLLKFARVIKALEFLQHSKYVRMLENIFKKQKQALTCVIVLAILYILASALVLFNAEPNSFDTFFDAAYCATMSLTALGHSGIILVTNIGKAVTMISSILGIVIVALPAAILTAGYIEELKIEEKDS
ncbi:MAG: ion transporter [Oscillospiraceae bacterium]|nr:ion transporter [Oscillospiraceae bacterium]